MVTLCVLKSGGDYSPEHVHWLARQVPDLVCLSDVSVQGVPTIPLEYDLPGWWSKIEAFKPIIKGDVMLIDLDTVVFRLPKVTETTVLRDFYYPQRMGSGFMYITEADRARVWAEWIKDPKGHIQKAGRGGDQAFLDPIIGHAQKWQDLANVCSYKVHCGGGLPNNVDVVCFHGKPRPWQAREIWIPKLRTDMKNFKELILKHKGKIICVMGGAASLESDLKKVNADIYISTNGHGLQFQTADYLLAMDETNRTHNMPMGKYLSQINSAPIISPRGYADYQLTNWPQAPRDVLSGMVATWAAFVMGAKCVVLAGMDAYGGDAGYVDEARKIARDVDCPVRVVSGSLAKIWEQYDQDEKFGRYSPAATIDRWLELTKDAQEYLVLKPTNVTGRALKKDDKVTLSPIDAARLLKHRMIKEA